MVNFRTKKIMQVKESPVTTIEKAAEEFYLHNKAKGLADETQKGYRYYVGNFANWCEKDTLLTDITPKLLDSYLAYKDECNVKKVSQASIMNHLRRFFRFCHSRGFMDEIEITIPKYERELKEPYTAEEMTLLLRKPKSLDWVDWRNWCMVNYFFATGQRLSTVLNIKRKDVDLSGRTVKLLWNKDKIQKTMPLSPAIVEVLKEYILLSGLDNDDYLFPEYEGSQMKKRSAQDAIACYNKSRGVNKTSIHLFRHTFAKNYIMNGGSPAKLQQLLNHKTIEMSMKYVALYGSDIANDLARFSPLDTFQSKYKPEKTLRRTIITE